MLTDDLRGRVALDPLCALIPARDTPFVVKHVDRIVRDAFNKQTKLFLALLERDFRLAPLRQIACDLRKTDELAVRCNHGIDDDMRPEARSVFSYAPAFAFELPFLQGSCERPSGQTSRLVLFGVKPGEVFADNLVCLIALEASGAIIPAADDARGIEHVDRVVVHRLDKEAIPAIVALRRCETIAVFHVYPNTQQL